MLFDFNIYNLEKTLNTSLKCLIEDKNTFFLPNYKQKKHFGIVKKHLQNYIINQSY
jgi:hypothetical protein